MCGRNWLQWLGLLPVLKGFRVQLTVRVSGVLLGKAVSMWTWQVCCGCVNHCKYGVNNEDTRRKFENYPLMETKSGMVRASVEPSINRSI